MAVPTRGSVLALLALLVLAAPARAQTATPIEHLIVVVGENLSFDNLFGTYEPRSNANIRNLLSQGIVNRDGSPGPEFTKAAQRRAEVRDAYQVTPRIVGTYGELPRPGTTYAPGLPRFAPDARFPALLPNGPFQITKYVDYTAAVGDPVHRFFQMWQQVDGGRRDLFVWVDETSGEGSQNRADPDSGTNQGAVAMGFYNMAAGDAPYFRQLADSYALSDNHHQPVMGGTGANFQALATGHAIAYTTDGTLAEPPPNQIENPNPRPGTNNWYMHSGYRSGSYTECSDPEPARRHVDPGLSRQPALPDLQRRELREGRLLPGQQLQSRLFGHRRAGAAGAGGVSRSAAGTANHRRGALSERGDLEMVFRRAGRRSTDQGI